MPPQAPARSAPAPAVPSLAGDQAVAEPGRQPQRGEGAGPEAGELPEPVERSAHQPVRDRQEGGGGHRRPQVPAPPQGPRRRKEPRDERPGEQQRSDEAGLSEHPHLEAVRIARLLLALAAYEVLVLEVVRPVSGQRLVGEHVHADVQQS